MAVNPLYRNDRAGEYAPSWYTATAEIGPERPSLDGDTRCDLAILGAGYTGLWAALTAARAGLKVIVLDAHRAGFGASGRNGGQVHSGYNKGQKALEKAMGTGPARAVWDLSNDAKAQVRDFCTAHAPEARYLPGMAHGDYSAAEIRDTQETTEHLAKTYGYNQVDTLDRATMQALVKSPLYVGGSIDHGGGHLHPLRYALALARKAEAAGVTIHERSEVTQLVKGTPAKLVTAKGTVTADHIIVAGNGYLPLLDTKIASHVMPINSFIAATEPLGDRWTDVLAQDIAVSDSKFVVNYYRMSEDRRFLFGGRENYTLGFPADIGSALVTRMTKLFPQLAGIKVDYVWGGTLAVTMSRLPYLTRIAPNILSGSGYSGHGVALASLSGRIMAEAVLGQAGRFDVMGKLPVPGFPGGASFRAPLLALAMTWAALRDRLGV